jgi:GNAT superfamily N-acetyltransferase
MPGAIQIRPIRPQDKAALAEGFARLGDESRYRRFLAPRGRLTSAELRYLTEVDHHDHEALVALDGVSGEGIGVARYVRLPDRPGTAEMAIAIADDRQGHGVGTQLAQALADRARAEGIDTFTAVILAANPSVMAVLRDVGTVHTVRRDAGTVELTVDLADAAPDRISAMLRRFAQSGAVCAPRDRAISPHSKAGVG